MWYTYSKKACVLKKPSLDEHTSSIKVNKTVKESISACVMAIVNLCITMTRHRKISNGQMVRPNSCKSLQPSTHRGNVSTGIYSHTATLAVPTYP